MKKPDYATARKFIQSRNFLWNAGIFVWSVKSVLKAFEEFQPSMFAHFMNGFDVYNTDKENAFIQDNYPLAQKYLCRLRYFRKSTKCFCITCHF